MQGLPFFHDVVLHTFATDVPFAFSAVRTQLRLCDLIVCVGHPDKQASQSIQKTPEQQQQHQHHQYNQ